MKRNIYKGLFDDQSEFSHRYACWAYNHRGWAKMTILPSTNIPKGKWEFEGYNMFVCSHCGAIYTTEQLNNLRNYDSDPYLPFYCPKCGADMRYEVENDE